MVKPIQEDIYHILEIFRSGELACKSALFTLLHALITVILTVVNIANGIVDFTLGILTIFKGILCMLKLLLSLCRDIVEQQSRLVMIERRLP